MVADRLPQLQPHPQPQPVPQPPPVSPQRPPVHSPGVWPCGWRLSSSASLSYEARILGGEYASLVPSLAFSLFITSLLSTLPSPGCPLLTSPLALENAPSPYATRGFPVRLSQAAISVLRRTARSHPRFESLCANMTPSARRRGRSRETSNSLAHFILPVPDSLERLEIPLLRPTVDLQ
jgi:hypothetical protein